MSPKDYLQTIIYCQIVDAITRIILRDARVVSLQHGLIKLTELFQLQINTCLNYFVYANNFCIRLNICNYDISINTIMAVQEKAYETRTHDSIVEVDQKIMTFKIMLP